MPGWGERVTGSDETAVDAGIAEAGAEEQGESTEALRAALKAERDARRKYEREFKATSSRLQEIENAGKSDLEKLIAERDAAIARANEQEARLRGIATEQAVRDAAEKAGATNGRLVWRLIRDDLELDDAGQPVNLAAAIEAAKSDAPQLFGATGKSDAGRQGAVNAPVSMTDLIRQRAGFGA